MGSIASLNGLDLDFLKLDGIYTRDLDTNSVSQEVVSSVARLSQAAFIGGPRVKAIEEAIAYQQLIDGFGLTQSQVANRVGRNRSTVANSLRLLTLPQEVQDMVGSGTLSAGHARAVLSVESSTDRIRLATEIATGGLSVREAERRARSGSGSGRSSVGRVRTRPEDPVARRKIGRAHV